MSFLDRLKFWAKKQLPSGAFSVPSHLQISTGADDFALAISAVWACVRAISDPIAFLPLQVFRRLEDGSRQRAVDHPLYSLLSEAPNPDQTALDFRHFLQSQLLLWGNAYAEVVRAPRGRIVSLHPIPADRVRVVRESGEIRYVVGGEAWPASRMFHIRGLGDGIEGQSVISLARRSFALAGAMERYGQRFFESGGRLPYVLKHPAGFRTSEDLDQFRRQWDEAYSTADQWHRPLILTGGLDYVQIGIRPEDAQFLTSRKFQIAEIARWFRVPLHLLGELDRATFSNIEHQSLEFIQHCLLYWARNWEMAIHRQLLTPAERKSLYAEFNFSLLLRGDYQGRTQGYSALLDRGVLSVNEVRRMENLDAIPDGDSRHVLGNMQRYPAGSADTTRS
ncbi:MAG: portal protein [Bryobacteraceae bacterium]|nr:MAG: portal protein [Bryobacteraceae bacterium]